MRHRNPKVRINQDAEYEPLAQYAEEEEEQGTCANRRTEAKQPCRSAGTKKLAFVGCGILGFSCLVATCAYLSGISSDPLVDVTTHCGVVRGLHSSIGYSFKGIPYAVPPVGPLRWKPPKPTCWNGTLLATEFKSMCAQLHPLGDAGTVAGSEDCLYLNIWTPSIETDSKLPVMVWIHGGYLHIFSGSEKGYCPTDKLAHKTQAVHVSFNYRLNAFGFMALELLREGSPTNTSGNYGFLDQITALQWVKENIQYFGGDPEKVTIYGQSSGGTSVWTLMMSPLAKNLFQRAVDMSGSYVFTKKLPETERDNLVFLQKTNCKDLKCLLALPVEKVLKSIPWFEYPYWAADDLTDLPVKGRLNGAVAVVDGYVVPEPPLEMWKKRTPGYNDVPFMIGTTMQEADFSPLYPNISSWTAVDYKWQVKKNLDTFGGYLSDSALHLYPSSDFCNQPERCVEKAYMTMVSDLRATCPINELAKVASDALSSPVYRYIITYTPSRAALKSDLLPFDSWFAFHMLDSFGFFGSMDVALGVTTEADRDFERLIQKHLVHFAKHGEMEGLWPQYPEGTVLLSRTLSLITNYYPERCALWENNGLYEYAWIN
uniref:Carboxylic ester hydrolase n=1 Tax=Geotrypetes seraphini TaxID=260995 RepID=A0A6P8P4G8_GEOSA|nr:para-nitrobenzyl esterase-like [Geotrypetes seraphini]XP_033784028.1 para-nitrobenzyl esterase-like [Geotrypetes seraphini]